MNSEEQIKENLKDIPNCFFLRECLVGRTRESIKHVIDGLLRETDNKIYELDNEWIRTYNFLAFLYWTIGEKDEAMTHNGKVLEMDESNLIAITNKILFCHELQDAYEVNITDTKLEKLQGRDDVQVYRIKADAELAYFYTRLGLSLQETARLKFRKVIDDVKDLKLEQVIDQNLIVLWKYGLGLITRRVSKLPCYRSAEQASRCHVRRKEAVDTFLDVVHEEWDSKRLKAMAYVQLGEISFAVLKDNQSLKDYFPDPYCRWDEERFYRTALTLYDRETYILERYGQFLRYKKRYDDSENELRKSLEIRPTSHAHHHLALTLKSKFHKQLAAQKRHFNRSISSPNKTSTQRPNYSRMQSEQPRGHHNPHVRNLFGTDDENNRPTGPQFPVDRRINMHNYGNPYGGYYDQGSLYYDNPQVGQYGHGFHCNDSTMHDSGYYSITQNEQYSTYGHSQYHSQVYSRPTTKGNRNRGSFNRPIGRGSNRGKHGAKQGNTLSLTCQSNNTNERMLQNSATANRQSIPNQCMDRTLSYDQNNQLDSGIDSLSMTMQQVTLQDKTEGGGPIKTTSASVNIAGNCNVVENTQSKAQAKHLPVVHVTTAFDINKTQAMIKSPRKLLELPEADSRTKDIMYHLDQALLYAENRAALYDKGLILRAMGHLDDAISVFKQLVGDETSLIYLANAYEQCGLCYNEKLQKSCTVGDELERITYNMKDCFMKSVAISAKLVAAVPNISEVWASASSLKEVLVCGGKSKESLKQLATLSERLSNYKEAITYYEDLITVEDDTKEIPKHIAAVATNRMKDYDYIGAVTVLDVARTHPDAHTCIDKNMYLKCLVEAGFQAIETRQDKQFGCKYLNTALCAAMGGTNVKSLEFFDEDCDVVRGEDGTFDVFLLCCEENEHLYSLSAMVWEQMKEVCGLNVTLNSIDVLWGKPKVSGILDLVDKCKYFVIVVSSQPKYNKLYQLTLEHIVLNKTNIITLLEDTETPLPKVIERFKDRIPKMVVPDTVFGESNDSNLISLLKQLLLCLLRVS